MVGSISIHLMLLFNRCAWSFTYWIIFISIHLMLLFNSFFQLSYNIFMKNFNTSNVTIQPIGYVKHSTHFLDFNTSNVTIQLLSPCTTTLRIIYFNTSNVTIQQSSALNSTELPCISIHLMLLFNNRYFLNFIFNFIISIHLMLLFNYITFVK